MKSLINYHNHTILCGHASGSIDEYIAQAIKKDFSEIGFSDHAPLPDPYQEGITMKLSEVESYISSVQKAALQYADVISVRLGLEVDFPLFDTFNTGWFDDTRFDYFIGSCHIMDGWVFDHPDSVDGFSREDINAIYRRYYAIIERMAGSGYFQIIGHIDLIKKFGHRPTEDLSPLYTRIAKKLAAMGTAFEINTSGLLKPVKEIYPSADIIKIFYENNVPVTMGSDTHCPEDFGYGYEEATAQLKKTGYKKICGFAKKKRYVIVL